MLIEFRFRNHRSVREEQAFTFEAGDVTEMPEYVRENPVGDRGLLTAAAVYGANASGKSNFLSAFEFMVSAVLFSFRTWDRTTKVPRTPFCWGDSRHEPSVFEVTFSVDEDKYEYGFVLNDESVLEEWLVTWRHGKKRSLIERCAEGASRQRLIPSATIDDLLKSMTASNALFLSVLFQHSSGEIRKIQNFFNRIIVDPGSHMPMSLKNVPLLFNDIGSYQLGLFDTPESGRELMLQRIRKIFRAADLGIVDVRVDETPEKSSPPFSRSISRRLFFRHSETDEDSWIPFLEESQGTKTLFRLTEPVFWTLESGGVLVVDELESSLHPLLGRALIELFLCSKSNPHGAQLIFTTHDTNLIGTAISGPTLRRDQVWFAEKDNSGSTRLYPLTVYHPRKSENLERGYLQGRYGAVPYLGDFWHSEISETSENQQ